MVSKKKSTILLYGGASFDPMSLNPVFGLSSTASFVSTIDNNTDGRGSLVDSITANTGQAIVTGSTYLNEARFNGDGFNFHQAGFFETGSIGDYNFLHDGSDWDIYFDITVPDGGAKRLVLSTKAFSTTLKGIMIYVNPSGGTTSLFMYIGDGTANVININVTDGAYTLYERTSFKYSKVGNNITVHKIVNGVESLLGSSSGTTWVSGNSDAVLELMTPSFKVNSVLNDVWIFNGSLSVEDKESMANRNNFAVNKTVFDVHLIFGDSLAIGQGVNANIESGLEVPQDCLMYTSQAQALQNYIERMELAVNQNTAIFIDIHGVEMKLSNLVGNNNAIVKFGSAGANASTFASSGVNNVAILSYIETFVKEMWASKNYGINVSSITLFIGANDSAIGEGDNVQADITSFVKDVIDKFLTYSDVTVDAKIFVPYCKEGPLYDATAYAKVLLAQTNIGNGSISVDEPTIAGNIRGEHGFSTDSYPDIGDGVHINEVGYVTMANEINNNM